MAVKLSRTSCEHARKLIKDGQLVLDERDAWSEHQPSTEKETRFIREHGMAEYGKWHLGMDDEKADEPL
jgi:hypothetical protein